MICEESAKSYCKDDISLIENYDKAIADKTQVWQCHHRRETIYSVKDLQDIGEYYNRPACELIFLTPMDHRRLHNLGKPSGMKGKQHSAETRKNMSEAHKGRTFSEETRKKLSEANKGKHHSEETRQKMSEANKGRTFSEETRKKLSEAHKGKHHSEETRKKIGEANNGENHPLFGKHRSEETRKKISEANKGKNYWTKGTHWYNNGVKCIKAKTCPEGFVPGRIK